MAEINRQTVISFPDLNLTFTEGIASGSLSLNELLCADGLSLGSLVANKFEVQLYGVEDVVGQKIVVKVIEDEVEKPLFVGWVDSAKMDDNGYYRQIVAYDQTYALSNIDVSGWYSDFFESEDSTKTIKGMITALCTDYSVLCETMSETFGSMAIAKNVELSSCSWTNLLSMLAEVTGTIPNFNRSGKLEFVDASANATTDIRTLYENGNSTFEDFSVAYDKVQIVLDGTVLGHYGDGDKQYNIVGNIFLMDKDGDTLDGIAQAIYNKISTLSYIPCEVQMWVSDFSIKAGAKVQTETGVHIVMENDFSGSQMIEQKLVCKGSAETTEITNPLPLDYQVAINNMITKVVVEPGFIQLVAENIDLKGKVTFEDFASGTVDQINSSVKVGGTNLITDSKNMLNWNCKTGSTIEEEEDGWYKYNYNLVEGGEYVDLTYTFDKLKKDTDYSFGIDIKNNSYHMYVEIIFYDESGNEHYLASTGRQTIGDPTEKRLSLHFKIENTEEYSIAEYDLEHVCVKVGIRPEYLNNYVYLKEPKLETGTVATAWSICPSDFSEPSTTLIYGGNIQTGTITANQLNISSLVGGINDGTTTIDGGKITANTITASQIASGTITATEIKASTITGDKINLTDVFSKNITASGTISGVTITGASGSFTKAFSVNAPIGTTGNSLKIYANSSSMFFGSYQDDGTSAGIYVKNGSTGYNNLELYGRSVSISGNSVTVAGYTLGDACAKAVTTSVTSGSANLVTSGGVYSKLQDYVAGATAKVTSKTVSANSYLDLTITPTAKAGYTFIGISGWDISGSNSIKCGISRLFKNSSNTITARICNYSSSNATNISLEVYCLYKKTMA